MTWHGVGALTFDVYGTLIDWRTGVAEALAPWAARHGLAAGRGDLLAAFVEAERARRRAEPELRYDQILALAFADVSARFGVRPEPDAAEAFGESLGAWPAFADAPAALASLGWHVRLGAIVDVEGAALRAAAKRLGAAFEVAVTAADAGAFKPDPAPFRQALEELSDLGVGFDQILHVGESADCDLAPAQALGLATCRIDREPGYTAAASPTVVPDHRFASLAELAAAVAGARGRA